jgi:hypothetical protein
MQYRYLKWGSLLAVISMLALVLTLSGNSYAQSTSVYFPQTGHTLQGGFLAYWQTHGGLMQQGYPITDEYPEVNSVDGKTYTTQYFERARFEFHPEQPNPQFQVLLGLLGREVLQTRYPNGLPLITPVIVPGGGSYTFPQTGHTVTGLFLSYWLNHGGLAQQGYPLTEAFYEVNQADGQAYVTQYFERARFEYHPEQQDPQYRVLLGLLGREVYQSKQPPPPPPPTPTGTPTPLRINQVSTQVTVGGYANGSAGVGCPKGSIVVGGGWSGSAALSIYNSSMSENGWLAAARNNVSKPQTLNSYAMCMSGVAGSAVQESASISLASGASDHVFSRCSNGLVTGGGFSKEIGINVTTADPVRGGWLVAGVNNSPSSQRLTAYLVCLQGANLNVSVVSAGGSVGAGGTANTVVGCPDGTLTSGGGFDTEAGVNVYSSALRDNGWQVYGYNLATTTRQLNAYAICVASP